MLAGGTDGRGEERREMKLKEKTARTGSYKEK
jgi:hypothetical protein